MESKSQDGGFTIVGVLEVIPSDDVDTLRQFGISAVLGYQDKHGSSILHYAAGYGAVETCKWLIDCGLDPATTSPSNGRTPLHWAARNGHTETCRLLVVLSCGNVDVQAKGQVTPLQLAVWQGHLDTCRLLVSLGADPLFVNGWGCGTAHWLGKCPNHGCKVHFRRCCVWLFEECLVSCNEPNNHGQTPLHKAAFEGNLPMLEYLVRERGIMDCLTDHQGNTAADCAERGKRWDVAVWIRRHASPLHQRALDVLIPRGNVQGATTPSPFELRRLYLGKCKELHPDKCLDHSESGSVAWLELQQAYQLLLSWWTNPEVYDFNIRMGSRNPALFDRLTLMWIQEWHSVKAESVVGSPSPIPNTSDLLIFERRLVSLLLTDVHKEKGLSLAQLPKEFQKSWDHLPNPKDYGCRKWIDLLQRKLSGTIHVEIDPRNGRSPLIFAKVAMAKS